MCAPLEGLCASQSEAGREGCSLFSSKLPGEAALRRPRSNESQRAPKSTFLKFALKFAQPYSTAPLSGDAAVCRILLVE